MTIDFTDDELLGDQLRAEVPAPGTDYWTDIHTMLAATSESEPVQRIDTTPLPRPTPFRPVRQRSGRMAAIGLAAALFVMVGVLVGTRIEWRQQQIDADLDGNFASIIHDPASLEALPGPQQNRDHWNAVYGVWDCTANDGQGAWLPAFDSTDDDVGIHSHGDGVISIHPFFAESAGRNATFSHFADAMNFELTDTSITLPDGRALLEGTLCGDQKAVVHLRRWQSDVVARTEVALAPRLTTEDLINERFYNDREVWVLALAPLDADIPLPPADRFAQLDNKTAAIEYPPPVIGASTALALDATVVRELDPTPAGPDELPSQLFAELTREPRPAWTESIVAGSLERFGTARYVEPAVTFVAYETERSNDSATSCVAAVDLETRAILGSNHCSDTLAPADAAGPGPAFAFFSEFDGPQIILWRLPTDTAYVVLETEDELRILTNPIGRYAYVRWDFSQDAVSDLFFYDASLQLLSSCPDTSPQPELLCATTGGSGS